MAQTNLLELLRRLEESHAEFILVGGLSAVLRGAPVQTYDVDIVYSQNGENILRLLSALSSLDAIFRIQPTRRLRPDASHLSGSGHLNLLTAHGPLDLLATIGENLAYEHILPDSSLMDLGNGLQIRVLNLQKLVELKEQLGGEKDLAVLPILRQTLAEAQKKVSNRRGLT